MSNIKRMPLKHSYVNNIICEGAVTGHAEKVKKYTDGKVRFQTILQTCGDVNRNRRMYPQDVMESAVERVMPVVKNRNFLGELDHPISDNQVRQTTVLYKEAAHLITNMEFRGNQIWGELETLPYTSSGKALSGLVLDNIAIGFSLRGLADLEDNGTYQKVLAPLLMIAFDCVQMPSHHQACIQEIHESHVKVVNESAGIISCDNGGSYTTNLFDQLVEQKVLKLHTDYWAVD
jgi:hypothetical protein